MKNRRKRSAAFGRKLISLAVASCFTVSNPLFANPTGPKVVSGQASFVQSGNLLQITNSPNSIINWQSFSIGASEITRFIQQSQASAVLNRVTGNAGVIDPSVILGALQSNGRVFLINPSGILFGAGAQIDVAGLIATSLNLSDADFLANRLRFAEVTGAGAIVNQGNITTGAGGNVYLIGPAVTNSGIITSPRGEVILAAGNSVELVNPGTPGLRVEITAPENEARNLGRIVADSGRIGIYAGLINHSGTLRADTVEVGKNGEILLRASKNIVLEPGSVISASGAPGGVHDGGTVRIVAEDTLDMQRGSAVHVDGGVDGGNGGFLELSGKQRIALNGEFTGRAQKDGYRHGSLLLDPLNISIGANGLIATVALPSVGNGVGKMLVTPDGSRIYIARPGFGSQDYIDVVDTTTNTVIASIPVFGGSDAIADMAISPDGNRLYALSFNPGGSIYVIDTNPASSNYNTVLVSIGAGTFAYNANPRAIAVSADGTKLYTAHQNFVCSTCPAPPARVSVLDPNNGAELTFVEVGGFPTQLLTNPVTQRLYVVNQGQLQEINTATDTLVGSTALNGTPRSMVLSADGVRLYLLYGGQTEVRDASTKAVIGTLPFGGDALTVNSGGTRAFLAGGGSVSVADLGTNSVIQTFATGGTGNSGVGFVAGSNRVYATDSGAGFAVAVVDLNVGSDATTGGAIAHNASPGATLSLPVSALNGAWSAIDLAATNNVNVNAPISNSSLDPGTTLFKLSAGNDVNIHAALGSAADRFNRDIALRAGNNVNVHGSIYQSAGRTLALDANVTDATYGMTASGIGSVNIKALGAPVTVDTLGAMTVSGHDFNILGGTSAGVLVNVGGMLNANLTGNFTLQGGRASAETGDNVNTSVSVQANAINIVAAGAITIAGGDNAEASGCCVGDNGVMGGTGVATANASATMTAATSINLSAGTGITIRGGDYGWASACCNGMSGGTGNGTATLNTNATVTAGTALTLTAPTVTIRGGDFNEASACCNGEDGPGNGRGTATLNANANVTAGGNLTITATTLTIRGGNDAEGFACCNGTSGGVGVSTVTLDTRALVSATNDIAITAGTLTVRGGNGASGSACCNGSNNGVNGTAVVNVDASAKLTAGRDVAINATGAVSIAGGSNAYASACCNGGDGGKGTADVTVRSDAEVSAGRHLALTAGSLTVAGGDNVGASACCNGSGARVYNTVSPFQLLDVVPGDGVANVTTTARAKLASGQNMTLTASGPVVIRGGDYASASACCNGSDGGKGTAAAAVDAGALVAAGALLAVTAGSLEVRGGDGAEAYACCNGEGIILPGPPPVLKPGNGTGTATVTSKGMLTSGQDMTLAVAGPVTVRGGHDASGSACCNGSSGNGAGTVNVNASGIVAATGNLTLSATSLTVSGGNYASASACCNGSNGGVGQGAASVVSRAELTAGQATNLTVSGPVLISGGDYASASACCGSGPNVATVDASAIVSAGTTLTLSATGITVRGGDGGVASASYTGNNTATVDANATLSAAGNMTLTATSIGIIVRGGNSAEAYASSGKPGPNTATTNANATVSSGGLLTVTATGGLTVRGGNNAYASVSSSGVNTTLVNANASMLADSMNLTVSGPVLIQGGNSALAEASCCADAATRNTSTVNSNATVRAANGLTLTVNGGNLTVAGGDNARTSGTEASGQYTTTTNAKGELSTTAGNLTVNVTGGTLTVRGGDSASASASASSNLARVTSVTVATGKILAGGNLSLTAAGGMTVRGGNFASADANGTGAATRTVASTNADGAVAAGGSITVSAASLVVGGGGNAFARAVDDGQNSASVTANAFLAAGTDLNLTATGGITVAGGNAARARAEFGSAAGALDASASVGALVSAGGMTTINAGGLTITGGTQAALEPALASGPGANIAMTLANANVVTGGDLGYTGGPVTLLGGIARTQGASGTANSAAAEANAGIQGGGNKMFNITGGLMIAGGQALDTVVAPNVGSATARAVLDPGTLDVTTTGDVTLTGGTVTGVGSAYAAMTATGPITLTIGGTTGLRVTGGTPGTGAVGTGVSPITVTFSGGGTQSVDSTQPLDGAFILGASAPPPPPPPPPPVQEPVQEAIQEAALQLPPPAPTQIHDPIFTESGQSTGASQTSESTQEVAQTGGGSQASEKEEKKTAAVCR